MGTESTRDLKEGRLPDSGPGAPDAALAAAVERLEDLRELLAENGELNLELHRRHMRVLGDIQRHIERMNRALRALGSARC